MTADLRADPCVRAWFRGAHHDEIPTDDQRGYLDVLDGFVQQTGLGPGALVAHCFLRRKDTGERFLSVKRRIEMNEWIDTYVTAKGWTDKQAVRNANIVRSFLVHNGVLIQGKVWRG